MYGTGSYECKGDRSSFRIAEIPTDFDKLIQRCTKEEQTSTVLMMLPVSLRKVRPRLSKNPFSE